MSRRLRTIIQSGNVPFVTAADKKASYRDCRWECFRFSCSHPSPMRGSASLRTQDTAPGINMPHQRLLSPESSTARLFAVDLSKAETS